MPHGIPEEPATLIPDNTEEREHALWQQLLQHHTDIQRLWKRMPQLPEQSRPWMAEWAKGIDTFGTTSSTSSTSTTASLTTAGQTTSSTSSSTSSTSSSSTTSGCPAVTTCAQCASMPGCWGLSVAGITANGDGANCTNYNGDFVLEHVGSCLFASEGLNGIDPADCSNAGGGTSGWALDFTTAWFLTARGDGLIGNVALYTLSSGNPCNGDTLQFALDSSTCCGNWPATLTLTPQ